MFSKRSKAAITAFERVLKLTPEDETAGTFLTALKSIEKAAIDKAPAEKAPAEKTSTDKAPADKALIPRKKPTAEKTVK